MTSLKSVRKRGQQLQARDVIGLVAFCFYPLEEKIINKSCFLFIFKVQTVNPFQDPINTLMCSKFTLNHWLKIKTRNVTVRTDAPKGPLCATHLLIMLYLPVMFR